ncbi:MAG: aminoacyl-tRNA hydrolase [Nanoarchaeota archaeon]|nr:aminoacyl-tRNA hydrolase [Nanoarchaeota archaeon]|tara:strand:- start:2133 stop:2492 length:360 start_codon:yes stop_codon:yes gene_type:complete
MVFQKKQLKQVIIVRSDLKLPKGKLAAQCCHASVDCVLKSPKRLVKKWRDNGMPKIVLKVKNLSEMKKVQQKAMQESLVTSLITDAGHTVVKPGTVTCLGIGPDAEGKIDKITENLVLV